ncbi:MAG: hypothetical protein JNM62_05505 [Flavobacteriales bacterium]|nr:hypothetical protein [Flavobacteriales bacterium]
MSLTEVVAALHKDVAELQRFVADRFWEVEQAHRRNGKGVIQRSGEFSSSSRIQWVYVVVVSPSKTTLYPMGWYFTRQGIHAFQIDAEGPATYLRPHVLERYRQRFHPHDDVLNALRHMHVRNYDKAVEYREYKGRPAIASAVEDGYFLGEMCFNGALVDVHTFYDVAMGAREPALREMRKLLEWRRYFTATRQNPVRAGSYMSWGLGFTTRLERLHRAA